MIDNEQYFLAQEAQRSDFEDAIAHPDPDPEKVVALAPVGWAPSDPVIAGRLVRAALKQSSVTAKLKDAMTADIEAWSRLIAAHEARENALRRYVEAYLLSTAKAVQTKDGEKIKYETIKTPWGTAYMKINATTLEYDDEAVLATVQAIADDASAEPAMTKLAAGCLKHTTTLKRKEFRVLYDSVPSAVKGLVKETGGGPHVVLRKEQGA